jgi:cyclophilin family peptidyl-prolyl cis-trans isomerase
MIQGGDFTKRNGSGGESIYGGMFSDERLEGEGTEVDSPGYVPRLSNGAVKNWEKRANE